MYGVVERGQIDADRAVYHVLEGISQEQDLELALRQGLEGYKFQFYIVGVLLNCEGDVRVDVGGGLN